MEEDEGGKYTSVFSPCTKEIRMQEARGLEAGIRIIASDSLLCMKGKEFFEGKVIILV